jgi:hypothetical protein
VFVFLLEAIGLTGLIGIFPPLRGMLVVTGMFVMMLVAYAALVVFMKRAGTPVGAQAAEEPTAPRRNVVVLPEIQVTADPALLEQDRRLVRLAR